MASIGWDAFNGCSSLTSITIPEGVTTIKLNTFEGCSSLTSIELPKRVTSIGNRAFDSTGLKSITIPKSVTSMGEYVFNDCPDLTNIYCEVESKPEGWDTNWSEDINKLIDLNIKWGSTGE